MPDVERYTKEDLAYMAGIIDGEGSICVYSFFASPHQRNGKRYLRHSTMLSVSNTSTALMDWIVERFGSKMRTVKRTRQDWKQAYHWQVGYARAAEILQAVLPYLVIKRRQAELLIEFQELGSFRGGGETPQHVRERRAAIADEIGFLNNRKRGESIYAMEVRGRAAPYAKSEHAIETASMVKSG